MPRPSRPRTLVFLTVVLLVEVFLALYNPPYNSPDERSHLQHAAFWRDEMRLPDPYEERPKIQQDKHPPYVYLLGALALEATGGWFEGSQAMLRLPGPYERDWKLGNEQSVTLLETPQQDIDGVDDGQLLVLRVLMLAHWLLAAFFLLRIADLVWPDRPRFAFAAGACCALIPQAALSGAAFTPDTPLSAFCAAAFYSFALAALGRGTARGNGLIAGAWLALALLSKAAAVHLLLVLPVAAWMRARVSGQRREAGRWILWTLFLPVLLAGWWYARNVVLYGDPFQLRAQIEAYTHSVRRDPLTGTFFEALVWDVFRTFFGYYHRDILLPRPALLALAGVCGVAVAGLLLLLRRPVREEATVAELRVLPLALTGFGVMLALTLWGNLTVPSAQGRYLYPALGGFLVLAGTGLKIAARLRGDSCFAYALAAGWIAFGLWGFHWSVLRHETVSRSRAAGEGGVLYYEDSGHPSATSYLMRGYTAPDAGQLGRSVPWRTLHGHPEAVLYRFPPLPDTASRELQVRVMYFNPDPTTPYVAYEHGRFLYVTQRLRANGALLHADVELTSTPRELVFPLPPDLDLSEGVELHFEKTAGTAAAVSEVWIERAWLRFEAEQRRVTNRTSRELPFLLLWKRGGDEGHVEGRVAPRGGFALPADVPGALDAVQLTLRELSPWILREAEAHPPRAVADRELARWLGDMDASGGYRMFGKAVLAVLPFGRVDGPVRFLARAREGAAGWRLVPLSQPALDAEGNLESRAAGPATSLDWVLLAGGWRR